MKKNKHFLIKYIMMGLFVLSILSVNAQIVTVGSGSYTKTFPGTDAAGRNGYPSGSPQLSGNAVGKPVPTNDWWSKLIKEDHAANLFNYPMTMKTKNDGLVVSYIPWGVIDDQEPIIVRTAGLNTNRTTISDYTDWTVTMDWNDGTQQMQATSGIGMPFLYFKKNTTDVVEVQVNLGQVTVSGEMLIVENARNNADFVFYAPSGSTWSQTGKVYASSLNGKDYWSMAMLPQGTTDVMAKATVYKKYAYVFPTNTSTTWEYEESTGKVTSTYTVSTEIKEGTADQMLQGLLPHQWSNLAAGIPAPAADTYSSIRGELKMMEGNTFSVTNTFKGILPTMPYLANYSDGFNIADLETKISQIENDGLATWTDSYNEGQVMNRLIQTARIADQTGNIEARDKMIATIKERLEDWLSAQSGERAFLFYYNDTWSAMLGYPAGHGQDSNINDHHFHWGYFIHAAAFMEQFEPGWADRWGDMVNLLVRDAASDDRNDALFPFLRNFSPYAGHCWANGFATFPNGNDQESTSESMQFNSSLIHWGSITGNDAIRDLGIYLYTTEQTAIEEYWLDIYERNFAPSQQYSLVSRVWGNSYDNGTFWTADITASYGIELYPMHGGSLYLAHHPDYVEKLWAEIETNTAILSDSDTNPNLWHDTFWKFLSFTDPQKAIDLYDAYPDRILKFGVSDAQTYHWLHAMQAMGALDPTITADHPIAAAFSKEGQMTYVAHNYGDAAITVSFSDGFILNVPAGEMATNRDVDVTGTIAADFYQAFANGSVNLTTTIAGEGVTKVAFYDGEKLLGEDSSAPYEYKATNLSLGIHKMYSKVYVGEAFGVTNIIDIQVGEQLPYSGEAITIPGSFESGHFDVFEGGSGQGIAYVDVSPGNNGDFRTSEDVDVALVQNEGATLGWISAGEWVEYTLDVQTSGKYDMTYRYASGNPNGGGPFQLMIDDRAISQNIVVSSTSNNNWNTWAEKTVTGMELQAGQHVLRIAFTNGEFNLGRISFAFAEALSYHPPLANAGENVSVTLPETATTLDGTASTDADTADLDYNWEQVYGPSIIAFSDDTSATPDVSNLEAGVYKVKLTVSDGTHSSTDTVLILVSETGNTAPAVSLTAPTNNTTYKSGETITLTATASDLDGTVTKVEFYDGESKLGEDTDSPYNYEWTNAGLGAHELTAIATDNGGMSTTSEVVNVHVNEIQTCTDTGNQAQQGSFSEGYEVTFETVGTSVTITFELLDTDKVGVVAYLWKENPFGEVQMDHVEGTTFSKTLTGLTPGTTISYGCKFAFAGGLAVTRYHQYEVGENCALNVDDNTLALGLTMYPNPATDMLHFRTKASSITKVELFAISGEKVLETAETQNGLSIGHLAKGMYLVKLYSEEQLVVKKLIKK